MRVVLVAQLVLVAALLATAHADPEPEGSVRSSVVWDEELTLSLDTGMRIRPNGKASVGAGIATRFSDGPWTLGLSLMRWHGIADDDPERSTELALEVTRTFDISKRVRGYVTGGVGYELVNRVDLHNARFDRVGAHAGIGAMWSVHEQLSAFAELTAQLKYWADKPSDVDTENELTIMLMFGFNF